MLKVKLQDIMSEDVVTIREDATVGQAAHLMLRFRINGILVTKKNNKAKVVGIITTTDLLRLLNEAMSARGHRAALLKKIAEFPVGTVCSRYLLKVQRDTKIEKVVAIMHKRNMHTIPIYDGNKLVGIVGRHDILNVAFG